jgi:serine-type D-Ala-D-Ala carboxypeptidase (penicillin-binding protein 5/6)
MSYSVLQPVKRRRRRRRRGRQSLFFLGLAALLAAASLGATQHWAFAHGKRHERKPAPAAKPRRASPATLESLRAAASEQRARSRAPLPAGTQLLVGGGAPRLERALRRPIAARGAILVDAGTGTILWARRPRQRRPVASTTKIMTGVLALEHLSLSKTIRINPIVTRVALSREGLRAHERVPIWKLLYGLMLFSGNDDALALAIAASGSKGAFLELMNEKARELGLSDTHFTTPSGVVDKGNYSSARDLAALARYAMAIPKFRAIVRTRVAHVRWPPPTFAKTYLNKNRLLGTYRGADGVKTGWTTLAGHCLVASARRGSTSLIAVVLHSSDPYGDARGLLNLGFANS